ncbi:hypothetical protein CKO40_04145 [Halochromatium glycolicum]|uniref:Uncharacterized protein n=1 Tax=Halochromatium glycolicum TaxID=85075 RepID=A0AAJ0U2S4_9GAMM|nr:hypothetical protein [Halochromatium glycolicum]
MVPAERYYRVLLIGDLVDINLGLEQPLLDRPVGLQQGAVGLTQEMVLQLLELARAGSRGWC